MLVIKLIEIFAIMISSNFFNESLCQRLVILACTLIFALLFRHTIIKRLIFLKYNYFGFYFFLNLCFFGMFYLFLMGCVFLNLNFGFARVKYKHVLVFFLHFYHILDKLFVYLWNRLRFWWIKRILGDVISLNFNLRNVVLFFHRLIAI